MNVLPLTMNSATRTLLNELQVHMMNVLQPGVWEEIKQALYQGKPSNNTCPFACTLLCTSKPTSPRPRAHARCAQCTPVCHATATTRTGLSANKVPNCLEILATKYTTTDVILLQECSIAFLQALETHPLASKYTVRCSSLSISQQPLAISASRSEFWQRYAALPSLTAAL
jgi:hypothetical protein